MDMTAITLCKEIISDRNFQYEHSFNSAGWFSEKKIELL